MLVLCAAHIPMHGMEYPFKPVLNGVLQGGSYLLKSPAVAPKLTRFLAASMFSGVVWYTFAETQAAQTFYTKLKVLSRQYPKSANVIKYTTLGGLTYVGLLLLQPGSAVSTNILSLSVELAKGVGGVATVSASKYLMDKMTSSFDNEDLVSEELRTNYSFKNIAGGLNAVPEEVQTIVAQLKEPEKFKGIPRPKGLLLWGQPGTGKTLLAKAIAGELNCAFFSTNAAHFIKQYTGTGPSAVKKLFDDARILIKAGKAKRVVIFIDELDGIGKRVEDSEFRSPEHNKTINAMLTQLDGAEGNEGIFIVAATNHERLIDDALKRAGRFDSVAEIPLPNSTVRQKLIEMYLPQINDLPRRDLNIPRLVALSQGCTPADINGMVTTIARGAIATNKVITQEHFESHLRRMFFEKQTRQKGQSIDQMVRKTRGQSIAQLNAYLAGKGYGQSLYSSSSAAAAAATVTSEESRSSSSAHSRLAPALQSSLATALSSAVGSSPSKMRRRSSMPNLLEAR